MWHAEFTKGAQCCHFLKSPFLKHSCCISVIKHVSVIDQQLAQIKEQHWDLMHLLLLSLCKIVAVVKWTAKLLKLWFYVLVRMTHFWKKTKCTLKLSCPRMYVWVKLSLHCFFGIVAFVSHSFQLVLNVRSGLKPYETCVQFLYSSTSLVVFVHHRCKYHSQIAAVYPYHG